MLLSHIMARYHVDVPAKCSGSLVRMFPFIDVAHSREMLLSDFLIHSCKGVAFRYSGSFSVVVSVILF